MEADVGCLGGGRMLQGIPMDLEGEEGGHGARVRAYGVR